jgi:hypothetical protein
MCVDIILTQTSPLDKILPLWYGINIEAEALGSVFRIRLEISPETSLLKSTLPRVAFCFAQEFFMLFIGCVPCLQTL